MTVRFLAVPLRCHSGPNSTCALINGSACELGWPSYAIDHSGVKNRAMEWASYSTQVDGELYYSVTVNSKLRGDDDCWEVSPCFRLLMLVLEWSSSRLNVAIRAKLSSFILLLSLVTDP
eukprot:SAG22_NODE_449_length_10399_cov_43.159515_4_plen_119_part_00